MSFDHYVYKRLREADDKFLRDVRDVVYPPDPRDTLMDILAEIAGVLTLLLLLGLALVLGAGFSQ